MAETLAERRVSNPVTFANLADLIPAKVGATSGVGTLQTLLAVIQANLINAYGLLVIDNNAIAEAVVDATPRKIAAWNVNGLALGMTPDHTSDDITADIIGTYVIMVSMSFLGSSSKTFHVEIRKNGVAQGLDAERKLGAGGDVGDITINGIIAMNLTDTIELYQSSVDGGSAMTITHAQLIAKRTGP